MELWIGALNLGLLYAFMAIGAFWTFRVQDFPDITVDGSFTTGAAVLAICIINGISPIPALFIAFIAAALAGIVTGLIHTKLNVNGLLAGILVMTALYSINLRIMGRSNIPLMKYETVFTMMEKFNPGMIAELWQSIILIGFMILFWILISLFFKTDLGISIRATGNNPQMALANGVNVKLMTVFGIGIANGLVGLSGGLVAQYQGFADIGMGIGTVVAGLASVIIGETVFRVRSFTGKILSAILGSVMFRLMIAFALFFGMNPVDLKLLTAGFVLIALVAPKLFSTDLKAGFSKKAFVYLAAAVCIVIALSLVCVRSGEKSGDHKKFKVGLMQITDHGMLNNTRDGFLSEMESLGYKDGENIEFVQENAEGDPQTVNLIINKFIQDKVDLVLTISTPCTQPAIAKIHDQPVVFATVGDPFIIGAGKSEYDHKSNVTGIYTPTPMHKVVDMAKELLPEAKHIGCLYDPGHTNSVHYFSLLKAKIDKEPDLSLTSVHVTNSSEVYTAALSLIPKGVDAIILVPDNIVYSALESVVKAGTSKNIPVIASDIDRLESGVLAALGYDFRTSGEKAAHVADKILQGRNPADIPFYKLSQTHSALNLDTAKNLGVTVPPELLTQSSLFLKDGKITDKRTHKKSAKNLGPEKSLVLFQFSDNMFMSQSAMGVFNVLEGSGILDELNIKVDLKNAQGEFSMAQAIGQDIVRRNYDYIITLSTPALQTMAQLNTAIPHVFGAVTDPYGAGVAKNPEEHQKNITGVATFQPIESTYKFMRAIFPNAKTIGMAWNPSEACSQACTMKARKLAPKYGFELVEINISHTDEVMSATKALVSKKVDLFLTSGDNTVSLGAETIAAILKKANVPYFTNNFADINLGVFMSIGADYYDVGQAT